MNSRHSAPGYSPRDILFGQVLKLPIAVRNAVAAMVGVEVEHVVGLRDRKGVIEKGALLAMQHRQLREP